MNAKKPIKRRDNNGRIDPQYASDLLEKGRETRNDDDKPEAVQAFLKRPSSNDELAEDMGEAFIESALSGEDSDAHERVTVEEDGGPFIETSGNEEFAIGTDESNIASATREPLPRTSKALP